MAEAPHLFEELQSHVAELQADPELQPDGNLFRKCELFLVQDLEKSGGYKERAQSLIIQLAALAQTVRQDFELIVNLLVKLVEPFSFQEIWSIRPPVDFVGGLDLRAAPFHRLILMLLQKAAANPQDAAILASGRELMFNLVQAWLLTEDTGVAELGLEVLASLLTVDQLGHTRIDPDTRLPTTSGSKGQGLIWRRVFGDRDIYTLLFKCTDTRTKDDVSIVQKSVAQGRLMSFILRIAKLDWSCITVSHHPDVEARYIPDSDEKSLLQYVAVRMVDADLLMQMNLYSFFAQLISTCKKPDPDSMSEESAALIFLKNKGLHQQVLALWLPKWYEQVSDVETKLLYGSAAEYIGVYVSTYPESFLSGPDAEPVLSRLGETCRHRSKWNDLDFFPKDLSILAQVPRIALLNRIVNPGPDRGKRSLYLLDVASGNANILNTLSEIFSGPPNRRKIEPDAVKFFNEEAAAARAVFITYFTQWEAMFQNCTRQAAIMSNLREALAAVKFITSIAESAWALLPEKNKFNETRIPNSPEELPSEDKLRSLMYQRPGLREIEITRKWTEGYLALVNPPISNDVFPWLFEAQRIVSHDTTSSAYRIAVAKWDLLHVLYERIKSCPDSRMIHDYAKVRRHFESRLRGDIWGGLHAGNFVATQEH